MVPMSVVLSKICDGEPYGSIEVPFSFVHVLDICTFRPYRYSAALRVSQASFGASGQPQVSASRQCGNRSRE